MTTILIALMLTFPRYAQTAWLAADGSARIEIEVDLPAGTAGLIRLPLGMATLTGIQVTGIAGATASLVDEGDRHDVAVALPAALAAPATLCVTGRAGTFFAGLKAAPKAFGNRTMTYRFLNSTTTTFASVATEVILPEGFVVTSVDDSEPPATDSSTTPPFTVVSRDGRHGIRVSARNVGLGGVTSVVFRFKERRMSPVLPIALVAVSVLYLFWFRGLTRPPEAAS